ncbi:hypothetical protein DMUE_1521 [Dictyocoela muelleri]|nr:hypothetical protein DMUE_1521 [Dictyocoela muelleri]
MKTYEVFDIMDLTYHNHSKDDVKFQKVLLNSKLKERAITTKESTRDIVVHISSVAPKNLTCNPRNMKKLVNRTRRNNNLTFNSSYDIPNELQVTLRNKKFLFFDSGMDDENRVVVFTTSENLENFMFSRVVVCDGTFK